MAAVAKRHHAVLALAIAGVLVSGCISFGPPYGLVWAENMSDATLLARLEIGHTDFPWVRIPAHDAGVIWQDSYEVGTQGQTLLYDIDCKQLASVDGVADRKGFVIADDGTVSVEHTDFLGTTGSPFTSYDSCISASGWPVTLPPPR